MKQHHLKGLDLSKEIVYLIDGTSLVYRSFFAIKLSTSRGFPTGAIFGFIQTLKKIISRYQPEYLGICFDVSRKTFRQEKFKEYKIQRPPLPEGLKIQIPVIKKLINYLGINLIEKEGFEADDIIATLVNEILQDNLKVIVVSSDKDIYQLLKGTQVMVYHPQKEKILTEKDFIAEFGFSPQKNIDYLALVGDSVDNVPGAKGIGKVTATQLIKDFGSIENIFNNLEKLAPNLRKILIENKESIFLSKELVNLSFCDLDLNWQDLKIKEPDLTQIYKLFKELEFKSLLKEFILSCEEVKVKLIENLPSDFFKEKKEIVAFIDKEDIYFLDDGYVHKEKIEKVKGFLEDEKIKKISYNFKDQLIDLKEVSFKGIWFDVQLAAYLIDSSFVDYNLDTLVSHYLGHFSSLSKETFPFFINKLYSLLQRKLREDGLEKLFFEVEMPLIYVLVGIERWGIKLDIQMMEDLSKEVDKRLEELKREIFKIAQEEFNLNSPQQLGRILFEKLKIPPIKKTKTGYSTDEAVLEKLSSEHSIASLILEYRELNKLKTTYILPLIEEVKSKGGRIYAKFNQTATQTGRLSSSSPNLQSIPIRGRFSSYLRKAFVSSFPSGFILSADYSQIELRILAHFSKEERLIEAFKNDRDIHTFTASLLFKVNEEEVDGRMRDLAKRVNFGIIYGMSSYKLSKELNVSLHEAESFIESYFLRYPKIKEYIDKVVREAEERGYVKTILGRRRYLEDLKSPYSQLREFARRQAINTPIQGSCADLIKMAMVRIYQEFKRRNLKSKLIIQIHDELLFDVFPQELEEVVRIVKRNMQECIKLDVPIKVNLKWGKNWAECKE